MYPLQKIENRVKIGWKEYLFTQDKLSQKDMIITQQKKVQGSL